MSFDLQLGGLRAVVTGGTAGVGAAVVRTLAEAGAWGFTIGGAIFEGRLPGGPDVAAQVRSVLAVAAET